MAVNQCESDMKKANDQFIMELCMLLPQKRSL